MLQKVEGRESVLKAVFESGCVTLLTVIYTTVKTVCFVSCLLKLLKKVCI